MLEYRSPVKISCELCCDYVVKKGEQETIIEIFHISKLAPITISEDFATWFTNNVVGPIGKKMDEFQERDSGKALLCIKHLQININKFDPTNGGSSIIDLPKSIKDKKAVVNVQNNDENCFLWSILSAMFPVILHSNRPSAYPQDPYEIFNLTNIHFPTPLADIAKFEKQNNVSINVYGLEFDVSRYDYIVVGPLHYPKNKKDQHINLLYWKWEKRSHYAWIKALSRLLSSQISKRGHSKWICDRCLQ